MSEKQGKPCLTNKIRNYAHLHYFYMFTVLVVTAPLFFFSMSKHSKTEKTYKIYDKCTLR